MPNEKDIPQPPETGKSGPLATTQANPLPLFQREPYLLKRVTDDAPIARQHAPTLDELQMGRDKVPAI